MENIENSFIVSNTIPMSLEEIRDKHIIPVFTKDNNPLISQSQLVETALESVESMGYKTLKPEIRVSHAIKGRIPEARFKKSNELLPHEITTYYERMMYLIRIPDITARINDHDISLVVGGVKSYSWDNLSKDHRSQQSFKFFAGFQVFVCSNLCVSADGAVLEFKTNSLSLISSKYKDMLSAYDPNTQVKWLQGLKDYSITESQFAHLVGRCSIQPYVNGAPKNILNTTQVNNIVKGYYNDPHFKGNGSISLWSLYNLFTESSKSSYIDTYLDRNLSGESIIEDLRHNLDQGSTSWYLS